MDSTPYAINFGDFFDQVPVPVEIKL